MKRSPMSGRKQPLPRGSSELERTPMPARKTPMRRTPSPKLSGTALSRAARQPSRKPWRPSRPQVTREEVEARRIVSVRSGGVCEICGSRWATNWHHRKAAGRVWVASNGMHLCGSGSTLCHGYVTENPTAARERGWSVPSWLDPAETPVWLYGRGWSVLSDDGSIAPAEPDDEENTA